MENSLNFIEKEMKFLLPPFAKWSPKDWQSKGEESSNIVKQQLGWDITDFGSGDFDKVGLFLFTIRNGVLTSKDSNERVYAEKIRIVKEEQITPIHFHYQKMEYIINRRWWSTGFIGNSPDGVMVQMPKEKPKGKELTKEQKQENREISKFRVLVEHAICGAKRCRIVKDRLGCHKFGFDDLIIELACGLHNYRITLKNNVL